jgi:quercetin dioxygenase-like cupin family protein
MSYTIVNRDRLPNDGDTFDFEGAQYDTNASFIWVDMPPGAVVKLHTHPYKEIFIIEEGSAMYMIGSDTIEAHAGQIIIAPADVPHGFVNSGEGRLKQVDIHDSKDIITHWLEE